MRQAHAILAEGSGGRQAPLAALAAIGSLQALSLLAYVARNKLAAVLLGPSGVGVLGVIDALVQLVAHFSALGLPIAAVKFLSRAQSDGCSAVAAVQRRLVRAVAISSGLGAAMAITSGLLWPALLGADLQAHRPLLALGLLGVPLLALRELLSGALAAARPGRAAAALALALAVAGTVGAVVGFLLQGGMGGFLGGTLLGWALVLGRTLAGLRATPGQARDGGSLRSGASEMLGVSLILWAAYSSYPLTHFIARHVILSRFGPAEAGRLQAALELSGALALVLGPGTAFALAPVLNRRAPSSEKGRAAFEFLRSLALAAGLLALPLALFPQRALRWLYALAFQSVGRMLFLFVGGQCLRVLAGAFHALLIGLDDLRTYGALVASGQLCFGLLSWLWGPRYGVAGVGLAFLISNLALFALTAGRVAGRHGIGQPGSLLGVLGCGALAPVALGFWAGRHPAEGLWQATGRLALGLIVAGMLWSWRRHETARVGPAAGRPGSPVATDLENGR